MMPSEQRIEIRPQIEELSRSVHDEERRAAAAEPVGTAARPFEYGTSMVAEHGAVRLIEKEQWTKGVPLQGNPGEPRCGRSRQRLAAACNRRGGRWLG
ncbi:hypothetical protein GCM10010321_33660 [Streptomyces chartreusis]|nr:hypothetical protein GCM10010321_33660 [Streptomyces chartreusis]